MAYSDFTLKRVKSELQLRIIENESLFSAVSEVEISAYLQETLKRNLPLALAINTEKARSELIIINILLELKEQLANNISLFSGIDFNVDKEKGLAGFCDFIISQSPEQLYLDRPVIAIVEAKNENIISGLGQCIAEMYAATLYNQQENAGIATVYGAVTTGNEWKFVKLTGEIAYIDADAYYISHLPKIMGILIEMARQHA
ncbi:hypothetical protein U14_03872 [Candidatus Moduliflexus flocculans]|uniref:Type I restriction enzyme R protein N-terminal domain-containing protein n=1 Tax=Candidatus Moduliflexus flocculans TaxID=1499966 RepID=A0A081BQF4_9BACT|nr:hypothetical protein U14_03872 [Candidatus Moduliflexus flocculans]